MADLTGQMLGQYKIGELIGRGGMAQVYRAHQSSMDRDVAIKIMASELTNNPEFVTRFEREARVIARLQHPHILPVIDFGRSGEHVYLIMRLITGGVLSERMLRAPLTLQQVERFLTQIASALEYAHRSGVIHRDLKPTNVLLDEQDNVYLTDFGIAKMLAGSTSNYSLTATGRVMGTPAYMAPEQWRSDPVDARTDIYALGVMLYEMLLGALPFNSDTPYGMMYKHFDTPPPSPRVVNPNLPDALEHVVLHALAKDPGGRYPSAQQMADEFSGAVRTLPAAVLTQPLPRASIEQIERATPPSQRQQAAAATTSPAYGGLPTQQSGYYTPALPTQANPGGPATLAHGEVGRRRGGIAVAGILLLLVAVAAVIGIVLLGGKDDERAANGSGAAGDFVTPQATDTQSAIVILTSPEYTATPLVSDASTATPLPSDTPSETPTVTPTLTLTVTLTATLPPTATPLPSATLDLAATADAMVAERLTQTAESWTDTPTPDIEATVFAALTGTASMWTATPSSTFTVTPSLTPSNTLPPPPTATYTRTPVPTATRTPTRVPTRTSTRTPTPVPSCNSLTPRMKVGEGGRTTLYPAEMTRIRRNPGTDQSVVTSIPPGLTFDVSGGPECKNGILWWYVEGYAADGRWAGWIGEGLNGQYWIEPFETNGLECPGSLAPRLTPGEQGRVKLDPYSPNRVRSAPTTSQNNYIGQIDPGEEFDVISGPVCDTANHWRWWYVQRGSLTGWTAEGQPGQYWLEPVP